MQWAWRVCVNISVNMRGVIGSPNRTQYEPPLENAGMAKAKQKVRAPESFLWLRRTWMNALNDAGQARAHRRSPAWPQLPRNAKRSRTRNARDGFQRTTMVADKHSRQRKAVESCERKTLPGNRTA